MNIMIRTTDAQWSARHGVGTRDGATVITVPAETVQSVTFAGRDMVRFDIRRAVGSIPSDYPNPWMQVPATFIVK